MNFGWQLAGPIYMDAACNSKSIIMHIGIGRQHLFKKLAPVLAWYVILIRFIEIICIATIVSLHASSRQITHQKIFLLHPIKEALVIGVVGLSSNASRYMKPQILINWPRQWVVCWSTKILQILGHLNYSYSHDTDWISVNVFSNC